MPLTMDTIRKWYTAQIPASSPSSHRPTILPLYRFRRYGTINAHPSLFIFRLYIRHDDGSVMRTPRKDNQMGIIPPVVPRVRPLLTHTHTHTHIYTHARTRRDGRYLIKVVCATKFGNFGG